MDTEVMRGYRITIAISLAVIVASFFGPIAALIAGFGINKLFKMIGM